jgi:hypothetical protein
VEALTSRNLVGLQGLLQRYFSLFISQGATVLEQEKNRSKKFTVKTVEKIQILVSRSGFCDGYCLLDGDVGILTDIY